MITKEKLPTLPNRELNHNQTAETTLANDMRRVKALARSGLSPQEIADQTGLHLQGVNALVGRRTASRPSKPMLTDAQWERAFAPANYHNQHLASKIDRLIELLSQVDNDSF